MRVEVYGCSKGEETKCSFNKCHSVHVSIFSLRSGSSLGEKVVKEKGKNVAKKTCKSFKLNNSNVVSIGTTTVKQYLSICPLRLVWFARYCDKMYSRHLVSYNGLRADHSSITSCKLINLSQSVCGRTNSNVKAVRISVSSPFLFFILTPRKARSLAIQYYDLLFIQIIPRFWLVKTISIIHHDQLLFTKFRKNFVIFNRWRQKCSPLQIIELLTEKPGDEVVLFLVSRKTMSSLSPLRVWKFFEWIIKQLLNSALVGFDEFCRVCLGV